MATAAREPVPPPLPLPLLAGAHRPGLLLVLPGPHGQVGSRPQQHHVNCQHGRYRAARAYGTAIGPEGQSVAERPGPLPLALPLPMRTQLNLHFGYGQPH